MWAFIFILLLAVPVLSNADESRSCFGDATWFEHPKTCNDVKYIPIPNSQAEVMIQEGYPDAASIAYRIKGGRAKKLANFSSSYSGESFGQIDDHRFVIWLEDEFRTLYQIIECKGDVCELKKERCTPPPTLRVPILVKDLISFRSKNRDACFFTEPLFENLVGLSDREAVGFYNRHRDCYWCEGCEGGNGDAYANKLPIFDRFRNCEPALADEAALFTRPRIVPSKAVASSTLAPAGNVNYNAMNLFDLDLGTAWVEGVPGVGNGQTMDFEFSEPTKIDRFLIAMGYQKSFDTFKNNGIPGSVEIKVMEPILENGDNRFKVGFPFDGKTGLPAGRPGFISADFRARKTLKNPIKRLRMTILDAVAGAKFQDTAISEILLFGQLPIEQKLKLKMLDKDWSH